jgi:hypothetical protein
MWRVPSSGRGPTGLLVPELTSWRTFIKARRWGFGISRQRPGVRHVSTHLDEGGQCCYHLGEVYGLGVLVESGEISARWTHIHRYYRGKCGVGINLARLLEP